MRFRQRGRNEEDPEDLFQRRIHYHSFIFSDVEDGPQAVGRILRTQLVAWYREVSERTCPSIEALMTYAKHNRASLLASYLLENKVNAVLGSAPHTGAAPRVRFHPRSAKAADSILECVGDGSDEEGNKQEPEKTALAADRRRDNRGWGGNAAAGPSKARPEWPGGKTVNGYEFRRDDSRVSARPPNGECYICSSPKPVARDCSHYSTWLQALLIHVDLDPEEEEKERIVSRLLE